MKGDIKMVPPEPANDQEVLTYFSGEAREAAEFFLNHGWTVEVGTPQDVVNVETAELQCGDGRYANIPDGQAGRAIFGATWGVMALKTGGDEAGLGEAVSLIQENGMTPAIHGAEPHGGHGGEFSCGLFDLWTADNVPGAKPFQLSKDDESLHVLAEKHGLHNTELPGVHEETKVVMSYGKGKTPKLDKGTFRLDGTLRADLGLDQQSYLGSIVDAVGKLTKGAVKTVRIVQ